MLRAHSISKRYPGATAVRDVTLGIEAGEFAAIVGRSGSGKSTLLAMLACLARPSEGRITFEGVDPWTLDEKARSRHRAQAVAMVLQSPSLLPELRAVDNVALPALLAGSLPPAQAYAAAAGLLRDVGLAGREDAYPAMLSGGEQRRVAIARALVDAPRAVLADEPTSDLDAATGREIVALLERLRRERGFALVVATHDAALAGRADSVYAMAGGALAKRGTSTAAGDVVAPPPRAAAAPPHAMDPTLGTTLLPMAGRAAFGIAVAVSAVMLVDSAVARYQRARLDALAERASALDTLAHAQLRASVRSIDHAEPGRYEVALELANAAPAQPIHVTPPVMRAYVQVGRQWMELPATPTRERAAPAVTIADPAVFRYRFDAHPGDYARLFSRYMHVRLETTTLVGRASAPADLRERSDSYYVYLKPWDADDREILREARFDGAPPVWIAMPPH